MGRLGTVAQCCWNSNSLTSIVPFSETCLNSVLAGPILAARRVLRLSRRRARSENTLTPRWLDRMLYALLAAEAPVAARLRLPYGTSAVVLARPR